MRVTTISPLFVRDSRYRDDTERRFLVSREKEVTKFDLNRGSFFIFLPPIFIRSTYTRTQYIKLLWKSRGFNANNNVIGIEKKNLSIPKNKNVTVFEWTPTNNILRYSRGFRQWYCRMTMSARRVIKCCMCVRVCVCYDYIILIFRWPFLCHNIMTFIFVGTAYDILHYMSYCRTLLWLAFWEWVSFLFWSTIIIFNY